MPSSPPRVSGPIRRPVRLNTRAAPLRCAAAAALLFVLAGCGPSPKAAPVQDAQGGAEDSPQETEFRPDQLVGRWKLVVMSGLQFEMAILRISETDGKLSAELVDVAPRFGKRISRQVFDGPHVELQFETDDVQCLFEGNFRKGEVRGNTCIPRVERVPAALIKTDEEKLPDESVEPDPVPGGWAFQNAMQNGERYVAMRLFLRGPNLESPMAIFAFETLLNHVGSEDPPQGTVEKIVEDFRASASIWGDTMKEIVPFRAGAALIRQKIHLELAEKYLAEAEGLITPTTPDDWLIALGDAWASAGQTDKAIKLLSEVRQRSPYNIGVLFPLARAHLGRPDEAMPLFAELAAMPHAEVLLGREFPGQELPAETVARLYREKHGNTEGLDAYLDQAFLELSKRLAAPREPTEIGTAADRGGRTLLLEVFTGAQCPPCVAPDLAVSALHHLYSPRDVIVVKYHCHIPAPDPLAAASEGGFREQYYRIPGTPMLYLNGAELEQPGGTILEQAPPILALLRTKIDAELKESSPVTLNLSAAVVDGRIKITAEASGEGIGVHHRLRLAITEDGISYVGRNGIRVHDAVMRYMPGGAGGVEPVDGKLAFSEEITLEQLRERLNRGLDASGQELGYEFRVRPMPLKRLNLVGWVQDDLAQARVLQAATVPVEGLPAD